MHHRRCFPGILALVAAVICLVPLAGAKSSVWTDEKGGRFKGEPVEVLGPYAVFRRSPTSGQTVALRALSPEDCVRVYREVAEHPPRAADWSQATGVMTKPLVGSVRRVDKDKLVPLDLAGRPEPQILVIIYGSSGEGESWNLLGNFVPTYQRIQRIYPGLVEAVFFGLRHDAEAHRAITTTMQVPWLVTDLRSQSSMSSLARFAPAAERLIIAVTREGVPIASSTARDVQAIAQFVDDLTDFLRTIDPENLRGGRDRLNYANATRPIQFAAAADGPMLIGNPLSDEALRQHGVSRIRASLDVGADGRINAVSIDPTSDVPAALIVPLQEAMKQGMLVSPAIDHGRAVAGKLTFNVDVPSESMRPAGDDLWMRPTVPGSVPLRRWLLLKPVSVPETNFTSLDHMDDTGAVVLTEMRAATGRVSQTMQKNAFNSDWFDEAGAGSVEPVEGAVQAVDGVDLKWRAVESAGGLVDFQTFDRRDYCIGYAWTEVEMPKATEAWLGLGSDDGVKIWLNGELVLDKWVIRPSRVDDDIVPMRLRAGKNRILIKIQNMTGDWSFITRLRLRG